MTDAIANAVRGSLVATEFLDRFPSGPNLLRSALGFLAAQTRRGPCPGLPYLADRTHLLFTVNVAAGVAVGALILRRTHHLIANLTHTRVLTQHERALSRDADLYERHRRRANHPLAKLGGAALALLTFLAALPLVFTQEYGYWWGHLVYGYAGLIVLLLGGGVIYYGVRSFVLVCTASAMASELMTRTFHLRPFHPDGCNGLSSLGGLIMYFWLFALNIAIAIFLALHLGYLGLENHWIVWLLALVGTTIIPLIAIAPLWRTVSSMQRRRAETLAALEPELMQLLSLADSTSVRTLRVASRGLDRLAAMKTAHDSLRQMNVWPFNPKAITLVSTAYAIQLALTVRQLLGV